MEWCMRNAHLLRNFNVLLSQTSSQDAVLIEMSSVLRDLRLLLTFFIMLLYASAMVVLISKNILFSY